MEVPTLAERLELMVVTSPRPRCGQPLRDVVDECLEAGATAVELRDEGATSRELYGRARELVPVVRRRGGLFLVNDRMDVATAVVADGVHLGPEDPPLAEVRRRVPPGFVLGYSTDDPAEARRAAEAGADYLGVGAVYGTRTKADAADEKIGPDRVGEVLEAAGLPGVGIGGIDESNAGEVAARGAGVAVCSAIMDAPRPADAVRRLRGAIDGASPGH